MALSIFKNTQSNYTNTPLYKNLNFEISLTDFFINSEFNYLKNNTSIKGIINDPLSIALSNSWGDSAGAAMFNKIAGFTDNKFVRAAAGKSYKPFIATDEWTQQKLKSSNPLGISFTFRAYSTTNLSSNPLEIIKFLLLYCSPNKKSGVFSSLFNNLSSSVSNAKQLYKNVLGDEELKDNNENNNSEIKQKYIDLQKNTNRNILQSLSYRAMRSFISVNSLLRDEIGSQRANATFSLQIGDENNPKIKKSKNVDWIITSFSFHPSTDIIYKNNTYVPLYVDFNISLETNCIHSNYVINEILANTKTELITKINDEKKQDLKNNEISSLLNFINSHYIPSNNLKPIVSNTEQMKTANITVSGIKNEYSITNVSEIVEYAKKYNLSPEEIGATIDSNGLYTFTENNLSKFQLQILNKINEKYKEN